MPRPPFAPTVLLLCMLAVPSLALRAFAADAGQFPLRVHIYQSNQQPQYRGKELVNDHGTGRANLYERGRPRGFDFNFSCNAQIMTSSGYETYRARWKSKPQILEVFIPTIGKPGFGHTCEFKVSLKDFAYFRHNGAVSSEPAPAFKAWMDKHHYDPEHGKNEPTE